MQLTIPDLTTLTRNDINSEFPHFSFPIRKQLWLFLSEQKEKLTRNAFPINQVKNRQIWATALFLFFPIYNFRLSF